MTDWRRMGRSAAILLWALGAAGTAPAQPQRTTIQDIIYRADGSRFQGLVFIQWKSFVTPNYTSIAEHYVRAPITDGLLRVELVPTTNASPGAYYLAHFVSDGKIQFSETWAVPPSASPLKLTDVRIPAPPGALIVGAATEVALADVAGLVDALNARPAKGPGYGSGRAAVINSAGELVAAAGSLSDCLRVDGSTGPCGMPGSLVSGTFMDGETPAGLVDGSNTVFTLSQEPSPAASLLLYRNGVLQKQALDYTLSGGTVQFLAASTPQAGDVLLASYRTGGASGTIPHVLCAMAGGTTSATVLTSLGSCTIPAGLLQPGDRVAVEYDYAHAGSATDFAVEVRWDNSALASVSGAASESLVSGRARASVHAAGVQLSSQTWGSTAPLNVRAEAAPDAGGAAVTVDFLGRLGAATADSLVLRNLSVLRYPAP